MGDSVGSCQQRQQCRNYPRKEVIQEGLHMCELDTSSNSIMPTAFDTSGAPPYFIEAG